MRPVSRSILIAVAVFASMFVWQYLRGGEKGSPSRTPLTKGESQGEQSELRAAHVTGEPEHEIPAPPSQARPGQVARANVPSSDEFLLRLSELNVTDKHAALEWAQEGADWVTGEAAEAREAMMVTLLVDLERMEDARTFARSFIEAHPTSRYRPLVQGVTGIHPRPGPPAHIAQ